jgi:hypothetical protein
MPVSLASSSAAAMHGAMVPIGSQLLTGSTSDVTFVNIPQGYQDLYYVVFGRSDFSAVDVLIQSYVNNAFSSYSTTFLQGDGSSATSFRTTGNAGYALGYVPGGSSTSGIFGSITGHILNYSNSSTFKTVISRSVSDRNGAGKSNLTAGLYRSTSPVTSFGIATYGVGNWVSGSRISLYGIRSVGQ